MSLPKIITVIGPTASGKTALGVWLCRRFGGEIVSADAKQVYRGMDIGTAKERELPVAQHLIDTKNPGEKITVGEYQAAAFMVIDELLARNALPVLVGGSGLYVEAVTEGYLFGGPGLRQREPRYVSLKLGIDIERDELKRRVAVRMQTRAEGILGEVKGLLATGVDPEWLEQCGIEYRYFSRAARGDISLEEAVRLASTATNQFIKRQYTWWRRHPDVTWVKDAAEAEKRVEEFLLG